jgi:hypothetical protein
VGSNRRNLIVRVPIKFDKEIVGVEEEKEISADIQLNKHESALSWTVTLNVWLS